MYAILTLSMKFPPDYVLDKMEMYEVRTAFKYQYYSVKDSWEQARLITYMTAAVNSTKKLNVTDIMQFPWEEEFTDETVNRGITPQEIKRLQEKAQQYLNNNNPK